MPTTSSASSSTPMSYDKFKPKFPLDPFEDTYNAPNARAPWTLDVDALPPLSVLQHDRRVILIIGQPTSAALSPLFASSHLASSLLIIASHRPPPLPYSSCPAVHTLRLRTPLAVADAGATRLIDVLEWALQVARLWRRTGGPKNQELMEEVSPGPESVRLGQSFGTLRHSVAPNSQQQQASPSAFSPGASTASLAPSTTKKTRRQPLFQRQRSLPVEPDPTNLKPFDALLHFLPADVPDKTHLKAAILVTTLTRPYLASPPARAPQMRFYSDSAPKVSGNISKRWSFFRGASGLASPASSSTTLDVPTHSMSMTNLSNASASRRTSLSTLALLRTRRSRLVHLMPSAPMKASSYSRLPAANSSYLRAQAHLIRSIEAFLLSFCFSLPVAVPSPIAGFVSSDAESVRARPYVLPVTALTEVLQVERENERNPVRDEEDNEHEKEEGERDRERGQWTLAELVLCGALEGEEESTRAARNARFGESARRVSNESEKGKEKQLENAGEYRNENAWMAHRAWIAGAHDVVVVHGSSKTEMKTHAVPARSSSQPQLQSYSQSQLLPESQRQPRAQAQPHSHPHLHPKPHHQPYQSQQSQLQVQAHAVRNLDMYASSHSSPDVHTKREKQKELQMSAYKSLAIEKRLPTPPEDDDEERDEVEDKEETVHPTTPNASKYARPHYVENTKTHEQWTAGERVEISISHSNSYAYPSAKRQSTNPERRPTDPRSSPRQIQPRARESYSRPSPQQQEVRSRPRMAISLSPSTSPSPSPISTSTSTYSSASTVVPTSASGRHSGQKNYKPARSLSQRHNVHEHEHEHEHEKQKQQHNSDKKLSSLPTPPDSEEASLESVLDPIGAPAISPSREHEYTRSAPYPVGVAASNSRGHVRARDGSKRERDHDRIREANVNADESWVEDRERDRDRRRRTQSHPSRPTSDPASEESTPPRRARTKPNERSPKEKPAEKTVERRALDLSANVDRPVRPFIERNQSSEGRQARRVPVPSMDDLLPPLPPPSPPPTQTPINPPRPVPTPSRAPSNPQSYSSSKKHTKWKFWKTGAGATVSV